MNALIDQTHIGPDAELLALCSRLAGLQAEWQRLYWCTSNEKELTTPADHAWQAYCDDVWPGCRACTIDGHNRGLEDVADRLTDLPATTVEGLNAKAAAIIAIREASYYGAERDDEANLHWSVLEDAARLHGGVIPELVAD